MRTRPNHENRHGGVRRTAWTAALLTLGMMMPGTAGAGITIEHAAYGAGVLVVRGHTSEPGQRVTLNRRYSEWSDRNKRFRFRVRFLPNDCLITLRAGRELQSTSVGNCKPAGGTAERIRIQRRAVADRFDNSAAASSLRVIRQPCDRGAECQVVCGKDEFAVNAYCPAGEARLLGERTVSCPVSAPSQIVAYCMTTPGRQAR